MSAYYNYLTGEFAVAFDDGDGVEFRGLNHEGGARFYETLPDGFAKIKRVETQKDLRTEIYNAVKDWGGAGLTFPALVDTIMKLIDEDKENQ